MQEDLLKNKFFLKNFATISFMDALNQIINKLTTDWKKTLSQRGVKGLVGIIELACLYSHT